MVLQRGLLLLESIGLADVLLPFLLIFTIVFAVFQRTKILGDKKNFNVIMGLVMALAVIIPHITGRYPPGADVVNIINAALPQISVVAVATIMILLLIGIFGVGSDWGSSLAGLIAIAAFIVVVYIFYRAAVPAGAGSFGIPGILNDPDVQAMLVIVIIFALVIWFVTKDDSGKPSGFSKDILGGIQKFFSKK